MTLNKQEEIIQDAVIKLAASRYVESEGNKILEEAEALNRASNEKLSEKEIEEFKKLCVRERKKQKRKTTGKKLLFYKIATAAAVFLLILNISVISVPAMRTAVLNFFAERHDTYTRITSDSGEGGEAADNDNAGETENRYRLELDKEYEVTYLPEGFKIRNIAKDSLGINIEYGDKNGNLVTYTQDNEDTTIHVDTENAEVKYTEIHGTQALMSVKENVIIIIWKIDDVFICVDGMGVNEEEMLKIARSVKEVEK